MHTSSAQGQTWTKGCSCDDGYNNMQLMIKGTLYIFMISDVSEVERVEGYPSLPWNIIKLYLSKIKIIRWKDKSSFDITAFNIILLNFFSRFLVCLKGFVWFILLFLIEMLKMLFWTQMNLVIQCFSLFHTGKKCRREILTFYLTSIILPVNIHSQWICKLQYRAGN